MRNVSLNQITVAEPCPKSWDAMTGDDRKRFCTHCNKHVHDLSGFTRSEAQSLIDNSEHLCIRMHCDASGKLITADDMPLPRVRKMLRRTRMYWAYAAVVAIFSLFTGLSRADKVTGDVNTPLPSSTPPDVHTMGIVGPQTQPTTQPTPTTQPDPDHCTQGKVSVPTVKVGEMQVVSTHPAPTPTGSKE